MRNDQLPRAPKLLLSVRGWKERQGKKPISFQTQLDGSVIFSRCNVKMKILKKCDLRPSTMAHGDDKDNKVWTNVNMKNNFFD
jgi:hypothetical protein